MLDLKSISKTFNAGTVNEKTALNNLCLHLNDGDFVTVIGGNGGSCLRMNLACPRQVMTDGLNRLKAGMAACTAHFAASPRT